MALQGKGLPCKEGVVQERRWSQERPSFPASCGTGRTPVLSRVTACMQKAAQAFPGAPGSCWVSTEIPATRKCGHTKDLHGRSSQCDCHCSWNRLVP